MLHPPVSRIFIGCATEDLELANAVFAELEDQHDPTVWDQDLFHPSVGVLERLEELIGTFDYAILVASAVDTTIKRSRTSRVPRDNLLVEFGLFAGAPGRKSVFLLTPRGTDLDLPTDLLGLVSLTYMPRSDGNLRASVRTACSQVKRLIGERDRYASERDFSLADAWPLKIVILTRDAVAERRLMTTLEAYGDCLTVTSRADPEAVKALMGHHHVDAIFADIANPITTQTVDLIGFTRDRYREISFALMGTTEELCRLPGVKGMWRETLQHYWKLPKDAADAAFPIILEDIVLMMFIYHLSGGSFGEKAGSIVRTMMKPSVAGSWKLWQEFR